MKIKVLDSAKKQVLKLAPDTTMFKSQIQFQTTYNIKCSLGHLATAYSEKKAWQDALTALLPILRKDK